MKKRNRPSIPEPTQRELWARAAGRCEFRGCNKLLYQDTLTQQHANLGMISHIIAFSSDGPRGHAVLSKALEKDISNLMLTCRNHAKIIDDGEYTAVYPAELLSTFKQEHELRIRMLTEATEDAQTHILLLQVPIDRRLSLINHTAVFQAILPKYPAEEHLTIIDLNAMTIETTSEGFFLLAAQIITTRMHEILHRYAMKQPGTAIAVFALAPIPLLIHFGHLLGDLYNVDLYQRHRDSQDWIWKENEEVQEFFEVLFPPNAEAHRKEKIVLLLSVSAQINKAEIREALGEDLLLYEIRAKEPSLDFLTSRKRLEMFGYEIRRFLEQIYLRHEHNCIIHLFAIVPAPMAIEFGRCLKAHHPPFLVYEYDKTHRKRVPSLLINTHTKENR